MPLPSSGMGGVAFAPPRHSLDQHGYQLALPSHSQHSHSAYSHQYHDDYDEGQGGAHGVEDELRSYLASEGDDEGWEGQETQGGYSASPRFAVAAAFSSSPSPSQAGSAYPRFSASQQQQQQPMRTLANYYAPPQPQQQQLPPKQPFFAPSASTSNTRQPLFTQSSQRSVPPGDSGSGGGMIKPMPLRPPARPPLSSSASSHLPLVRPSASNTSASHTTGGKRPRHQLEDLDEDEERYWAAGPEGEDEEGWERALMGVDEGVEGVFGGGGNGSTLASSNLPRPSQRAQGSQFPAAAATKQHRLEPAPRPAQHHPQQVEEDVRYFDDLDVDPFASTPAGTQQRTTVRGAAPRRVSSTGEGEVKRAGIRLRPVSELPDMFRSLWRFGVFNGVQSACFDSVYHSDENVVVSAPTGAGKTVLFELAIIRLFTTSSSDDTKVLYMAPTKSLCTERATDWKRKFEHSLGWAVQELTGDSETSISAWREVAKARIVVTTPEKWDAMTRKWHDHGGTLGQLRLFCVDEVHTVGADVRGAVLEVVVSRMKTLGTQTRFIAVSATVPNIRDVAEWLGRGAGQDEGGAEEEGREEREREGPARMFKFGDDFRPCKLQKFVYGYPKKDNDFAFANVLSFKLHDLIKQHASGKPVLVFCATRKGCTQAADALVKEYKASLSSSSRTAGGGLAWPKPPRAQAQYKTSDKHLAGLLESGVAVHHAGMEVNDRRLVESLFIEGGVSVVCSTSTLAVGVNLPARMVIIRGTKGFADGQMKEYSELEITQMLGRAGRPQFDTMGVACIMTDRESQHRYENLVNSQNKLESCLHKSLTEHVNSEITLRTIADVPSALHWLRSTFLFVRITKNPGYYALGSNAKDGAKSPDERLEEICVKAVEELVQSGVVEREGEELGSTHFGDIMSRYYISHATFLALKSLPLKSSMRTLLETLAGATEFASYRWRQGEKSVLGKYNKNLKFPAEKVASAADRTMIILQLVLDGVPGTELKSDNINPLMESRAIFSAAVRIAKAMVDVAVEREDGAVRTVLELLRSLNGRCWDSSSFVLRQLEGIGEKSYKALVDAGIRGFEDVWNAEPERLEIILSRKPPFGRKMIQQAKTFPQFELTLVSNNETTLTDGVQVDASFELRLKETKPPAMTKRGPIKLWATIASTTSDGEFIDFRRVRLDTLLATPKQFDLSVVLVKPSQRIVVSVSCEVLAGTEVKANYKPYTKPSAFAIPTLGPSDWDEEMDELPVKQRQPEPPKPAPATKSSLNKPAPVRKKTIELTAPSEVKSVDANRLKPLTTVADEADEEDDPYVEPRQREDGKYECNHACHDKTSCKHLCCREGLDRPPRRKAKTASVASNKPAKKAKTVATLDKAFSVPVDAQNKPLRLPPKPSKGVSLFKKSGARATTAASDSDDEIEDADNIPSLDELVAAAKTMSKSTLRRTLSASNRALTPPKAKPSFLDLDLDDSERENQRKEYDQLLPSSPSPPQPTQTKPRVSLRSLKRSAVADDFTLGGSSSKRRKASLGAFASSSSSEADVPLSTQLKTKKKVAQPSPSLSPVDKAVEPEKEDLDLDPLFRHPSPPADPDTPPISTQRDVDDPFDDLAVDSWAFSPALTKEDELESVTLAANTSVGEAGALTEIDEKTLADIEVEKEEEGTLDEEDDFDAWLEQNVVVV
ncbi:hypothetical protein JCM8097_005857 [Rhodosporidiobolus ruineniae]